MSNIPPISEPNQPPAAIASGKRQKSGLSPEARAWLGLEPADFPIYAAMIGAGALFFVRNPALEVLISLICLALGVYSCFLGMKPNPQLSRISNVMKFTGYPAGIFVVVVFIFLNFLSWNPNPRAGFFPF